MENDVKKNVNISMKRQVWNMKRKCIWQYIWPFSASQQQDNKIFRNTYIRLSANGLFDFFLFSVYREKCDTMLEYEKWRLAQQHLIHSHNFRCIWKRKSLLSLYSFTAVDCQLNSEHILCDSLFLCLWFHSEFVVTFVNVTLHRFKRWNETWEYDTFCYQFFFLKNLTISIVGVWRAVSIFHIDWFD